MTGPVQEGFAGLGLAAPLLQREPMRHQRPQRKLRMVRQQAHCHVHGVRRPGQAVLGAVHVAALDSQLAGPYQGPVQLADERRAAHDHHPASRRRDAQAGVQAADGAHAVVDLIESPGQHVLPGLRAGDAVDNDDS